MRKLLAKHIGNFFGMAVIFCKNNGFTDFRAVIDF